MSNSHIANLATKYQVSTATLHNWVRLGHIRVDDNRCISEETITDFLHSELGSGKLSVRANKLLKDEDNYVNISQLVLWELESDPNNCEQISSEYPKRLSESFRNKEGIYYTPGHVVENILHPEYFRGIVESSFCDPCCGTGNYLIQAIKLGFNVEKIYGFDTDATAVEIAKKRIYKMTGIMPKNIFCRDFLDFLNQTHHIKYDYLFTNPPWGKKFESATRKALTQNLGSQTDLDSVSLFYYAIMKSMKKDGLVGLLLPESVFNIGRFEEIRKDILSKKIVNITEYGKIFTNIMSSAVNIVLYSSSINCNSKNDNVECTLIDQQPFVRDVVSFKKNPQHIINFRTTPQEQQVVERVFTSPHVRLKNNAYWGLGIVTGDNKKFVKNAPYHGSIPVIKGTHIAQNKISNERFFIDKDMDRYQQTAPLHLYEAKQKLIYKFISSKLVFAYDDQQIYTLNSANIMITYDCFPVDMKNLSDILNSDFMNWIFKKIFATHKILRKDLEELPISCSLIQSYEFNEYQYIAALGIERTSHGSYRIKE